MANFAKKNISLNDLKLDKFDSRYLFVAILVVLLVLEAWVVQTSVSSVLELKNSAAAAPASQPADSGINFKDYDAIVQRIQNAATFKPAAGPDKNPF